MKVVFAIDSMKGSLTSVECGNAAAIGLKRAIPDAEYVVRPLADGGEGTVIAVTTGCNGELKNLQVTGPLGKPVDASYGIIENPNKTAIIEISAAAGLTLVPEVERDPFDTTTYGVGELILDALNQGCRHFIIGLGGSATNDVGIGMLQALGVVFYDSNKNRLRGKKGFLTGSDLEFIDGANLNKLDKRISECTFRIACDVNNPLTGAEGASKVFGPQKGLFDSEIVIADKWMRRFAKMSSGILNKEVDVNYPGTGAAGGLGFAFKYFLGGELEAGNKIVIDETNLKQYISEADIVVTGEGMLDSQTLMGKAPIGIAHIAKVLKKPVIAIVGSVAASFDGDIIPEIDAYFPILRRPISQSDAVNPANAKVNISATTEQIFRMYNTFKK